MAFFKFRKGGDDHTAPAPAPESVEALRKRARHRLIGAAILVLVGVIGFPLLFDNQPRPIAVDIPIEIPDKAKVKPLATTPQAVPAAAPQAEASAPVVAPTPAPAPVAAPAAVAVPVPVAKVEPKPEPKPETKPAPSPAAKPVEKPVAVAKAPATARYVVQVGAFAEVVKAREVRQKLEKAGLKTYTQVVETGEGKRIRVRIGPFETRSDVDKVAEKIRKLDLPAAILEL